MWGYCFYVLAGRVLQSQVSLCLWTLSVARVSVVETWGLLGLQGQSPVSFWISCLLLRDPRVRHDRE